MAYQLNWRYLLKLAVVPVVAGAVVHFVHRAQVRKQAGALLHLADRARDANPSDAKRHLAYLRRYLQMKPSDVDARERLGRLMTDSAKGRKQLLEAYLVLEDVLRRDDSREKLRRYVIDVAMSPRLDLFPEAQGHLDVLISARPNDGQLEGLYARCMAAREKYATNRSDKGNDQPLAREEFGALDWYSASIQHRPDLLDSYRGKAAVLRHLNRKEEADAAIVEMLSKNGNNHRTHLLVAEYWRAFGAPQRPAEAIAPALAKAQGVVGDPRETAIAKAVAQAQKLAPDDLDVLLLAADTARSGAARLIREGKRAEAQILLDQSRALLAHAVQLQPKSPAAYLAMASLEAATRGLEQAIAFVKKGHDALPDSSELAIALLDYQIRAGKAAEAAETLELLRGGGLPLTLVEFQQARIAAAKNSWLEASLILEKVLRDGSLEKRFVPQVHLLLGQCYQHLGEDDRRLAAYQQALPVESMDPLWVSAMSGIAGAEASLGQATAALATYRKLADQAPGAWVQVAQFELMRALQSPVDKRDWKPVEDSVAIAERVLPEETAVQLLRADLLHFRGKSAEARKMIVEMRARRPKEVAIWLALAVQDVRDGNPAEAQKTLDAAAKEAGDSLELRMTRLRFLLEGKQADLPAKLEQLGTGIESFSNAQKFQLLRGLAETASPLPGAEGIATRLWDRVVQLEPHNLKVRLIQFDRAIRAGDEAAMERTHEVIREVDGEKGTYARLARALILIWRAQHRQDASRLDDALLILDGLARERSRWARVALAQALVYDLKQDPDAAMNKYQEAVESGESNPEALRRLFELLYAKRRFVEAEDLLRKLPDSTTSSVEIQRLAAEVSLQSDNLKRALEFASRAVSESSKDPKDLNWFGTIHLKAGNLVKAQAAFRKAAELAPEKPDGWLLLIYCLIESGRKEEAERLLEPAKQKIAAPERALFAALAADQLRKTDDARKLFEQARKEQPGEIRILRAEADFLLRSGLLEDAQEAFLRVMKLGTASPEDREFARRMVALCIAANPDYQTSRKALEQLGLLEGNALRVATERSSPAELRVQALALALQRDKASKEQAIRILEGARESLSPNDTFLLAQTYLAVGKTGQVRLVMSELLRKADNVPLYVNFFTRWLIRQGSASDLEEAAVLIRRLEQKLQPEALETFELKARLLAARKDLAGARAAIVPRASAANAPLPVIARICEEIELLNDAEALWKRFVDENVKARPQVRLALAVFYARRGRTAEAMQLCEAARSAAVALPMIGEVAVLALYNAQSPPSASVKQLVGWLEEGIGKSDASSRAALIQLLASVRNLEGDYAASIKLYTQAIEANQKDVLALNNLAYLLSFREGKHDDALRLVERAKQTIGENSDLLDTEALIRLNKSEVGEARRILEGIVAIAPTATTYYHLAQAELAADRKIEAMVAWKKSGDLGIRRSSLHPLEWERFEKMAAMMK